MKLGKEIVMAAVVFAVLAAVSKYIFVLVFFFMQVAMLVGMGYALYWGGKRLYPKIKAWRTSRTAAVSSTSAPAPAPIAPAPFMRGNVYGGTEKTDTPAFVRNLSPAERQSIIDDVKKSMETDRQAKASARRSEAGKKAATTRKVNALQVAADLAAAAAQVGPELAAIAAEVEAKRAEAGQKAAVTRRMRAQKLEKTPLFASSEISHPASGVEVAPMTDAEVAEMVSLLESQDERAVHGTVVDEVLSG